MFPLEICANKIVIFKVTEFYRTLLSFTIKDSQEEKYPNILCLCDMWSQQDMWLNELPDCEEPKEGMSLIVPIDFTDTEELRSRQIEIHFVWPQGLIWFLPYGDFKFIIHAICYFYNQWETSAFLAHCSKDGETERY